MVVERRRVSGMAKAVTRATSLAKGEAPLPMITGVAAVFYNPADSGTEYVLWDDPCFGRCVERIMPGAFDDAMNRPDDVRGLFNHDANRVLGRTKSGTMRLWVSATGLEYEIEPADTDTGEEVCTLLDRGDVDGSSFAFMVDEERWTDVKDETGKWNTTREILKVTIYDVGPVTFPAYTSTAVGVAGPVDGEGESEASARDQRGGQRGKRRDWAPGAARLGVASRPRRGEGG